jgi:hypothetical protein
LTRSAEEGGKARAIPSILSLPEELAGVTDQSCVIKENPQQEEFMRWEKAMLVLAVLVTAAAPAPAIDLFGKKKATVSPDQRVQQLITIAQTAPEPSRRADAVEELRDFSTATYPYIVPVLVDILNQDKSVIVRVEAARTLGRIRPVTKTASDALSEASAKDSALRVRWQAKTSLTLFNMASISLGNQAETEQPPAKVKVSFKESPSAAGQSASPSGPSVLVPSEIMDSKTGTYALPLPKGPNPVSVFNPAPKPAPVSPIPGPLPTGPTTTEPPLNVPAPKTTENSSEVPLPVVIPDVGPILGPPQ